MTFFMALHSTKWPATSGAKWLDGKGDWRKAVPAAAICPRNNEEPPCEQAPFGLGHLVRGLEAGNDDPTMMIRPVAVARHAVYCCMQGSDRHLRVELGAWADKGVHHHELLSRQGSGARRCARSRRHRSHRRASHS